MDGASKVTSQEWCLQPYGECFHRVAGEKGGKGSLHLS